MTKQLFRVAFTNPKSEKDGELVSITKSFEPSDRAMSKYAPVHVFEVPVQYARERGIGAYGRDLITEFGNTLLSNH